MNKIVSIFVAGVLFLPFILYAQQTNQKGEQAGSQGYSLESDRIDDQEKTLDGQIGELNKKIAEVIRKYNLVKIKDIRFLPYQTSYKLGDNFIEIEKHIFLKNEMYPQQIAGIERKTTRLYTDGSNLSKIEIEVYESIYSNGFKDEARISDPSPLSGGCEDIVFTHIWRGKTIIDNKKMSEIKNTTAFPTRIQIKRDFLVPHLNETYRALLFIAESYFNSMKDSDLGMKLFLERSTKY